MAVVARDAGVQMQGLVVGVGMAVGVGVGVWAVLAELAGQSMDEGGEGGYRRLTILCDTVSFQDRRTTGKAITVLGNFVSVVLDRA